MSTKILLLLAALLLVATYAKEAEVTEASLKKMKIKDLRAFLDARGAACHGCTEKADFVRKALSVKDMPVKNEVLKPVEVKSDPIWEQWRDAAKEICEKDCPSELQSEGYCKQLANVVEGVIEQQARKFHKDLSVKPLDLIKYSMTHPYKVAGELLIKKALKFMVSKKTKSMGKIQAEIEKPLTYWLRDCALQNINTMNDILRDEL